MDSRIYKKDRACKKCGEKEASAKYENFITFKMEFILRTCNNCGYAWDEKPLDTQTPKES